ncbi:NADH-quinone oxidoreductase subunit 5 family protein [Marinoscillum furvescens]|uniref:NADH dehydrogenase subunit L n=1 Tax=Marinoscillum furvescens DSM 4134 TaxID=1122208 RepID=A0A3D9KVY1_MARFU|nr:NADH-quinone oxidoreductase subunit L [Marinoscillum furvescens]RED91889.1 NADH dehydrogenase subunit L [Marinoscillum furvescens DSM 4134]
MSNPAIHLTLVLLLPLAGGILTYLSGQSMVRRTALVGMVPGLIAAGMLLFMSNDSSITIRFDWLPGHSLGWQVDHVSAVLIALVYFISFLVHLFSLHYLQHDPSIHRYFAKLGFFTTSMLGLLAADHLLLVFVFWELVGFSSYLLIGFWFSQEDKAKSAREAFMVNRVADAGLLIGVILMVMVLDQPFLSELSAVSSSPLVHLAGIGLLIGALGKSAQFPFFGWLPKAMAGPTPVSALIHAATMVAAGVYLLFRVVPVLSPLVMGLAAILGAVTALMAAIAALTQHDIKKVLAYSTISQLGYMVLGVGVGAYQASLFHLWTHAFFKAGLFMAAGAVIHYFHELRHDDHEFDGQDMRNMGGLRKVLPVTHLVYLLCGLALSGLPFFSGFLSKEGILSGAWIWASQTGLWAYVVTDMAFITAFLTPLYVGRQILLVFYGEPRTVVERLQGMEPLWKVKLPLLLLAIASVWVFSAINPFNPTGWWLNAYLFSNDIFRAPEGFDYIEKLTFGLSVVLSAGGLLVSYWYFRPSRSQAYSNAGVPQTWYGRLSYRGWFMAEVYAALAKVYDALVMLSAWFDRKVIDKAVNAVGVASVVLSKAAAIFDREIIDGLVNLMAWLANLVGRLFTGIQSGKVQHQLVWMMVVLLAILLWFQF